MDDEKKIDFLYNAISDTQELIKFSENKAGFAFGIITGYTAVLFVTLDNLIKHCFTWPWYVWVLVGCIAVCISTAIWVTARIVSPISNPINNLNIKPQDIPSAKFFLTPNKYSRCKKPIRFAFKNSTKYKLDANFTDFYNNINQLTPEKTIQVLSIELFKLSYIRNIKNDRLRILVNVLIVTTFFLILYYIVYQFQLHKINKQLIEKSGIIINF